MNSTVFEPNPQRDSTPAFRAENVVRLMALFASAFVLVLLCILFSREVGRVAALWPLNAIILALLSRYDRADWPTIIGVVFLANAAANSVAGDTVFHSLTLASANSVEVWICAYFLFSSGQTFDISRPSSLFRFLGVAVVAAPLCSAAIGSFALLDVRPFEETYIRWFVSDALGMLVFAPALFIFGSRSSIWHERPAPRAIMIGAAALLLSLLVVFGQTSLPLLFLVPPALVLATLQLGIGGAAAGILVTALVSIVATIAGSGPIQLIDGDPLAKMYTLQCFLGLISLTNLPVAAALARATAVLSDSKRSNAELTAARSEALEYAQRYRDLADYTTDIVIRYGPGGIISYASPSIRVLGIDPDTAIGMGLLDLVVPEDKDLARKQIEDSFGGKELVPTVRREVRVLLPDGSTIWLEGIPTIIPDAEGRPKAVVDVYRDTTARRELEDSLLAARHQAEAAVKAKSEFLANMSHELRTPLNSIIGFSDLLVVSKEIPSTEARYVEVIASSSQRLLGIVNDILDLSSLEAGAVRLESRRFSIRRAATQTVESLRVEANKKHLALMLSIDPNVAELHLGDEGRFAQVLLNLLSNAVKFTPSGRVETAIAVTQSTEEWQSLVLTVRDTGIGIPADRIPTLFARFEQGDASINRRYGGTGLGLAIVRHLVEQMGGTVKLESVEGRGTCFQIDIRLTVVHDSPVLSHPPAAGRSKPRRLLHILIVDDVDINRELAQAFLAMSGHHVSVAADGAEAVEMVRQNHFDIVFMDIRMPVMDGLAATRAIRESESLRSLPIIALTAQALPDQMAASYEAGMVDHLAKPVTQDLLEQMIAKWAPMPQTSAADAPENSALNVLRARFIGRCTRDLEVIRTRAVEEEHPQEHLYDLVHRLAGSASMLDFTRLGTLARELNRRYDQQQTVSEADLDELASAIEELQDTWQAAN